MSSAGGLAAVIQSPCGVSESFDPATVDPANPPKIVQFTAIWDTGATHSCITQDVIAALGLKPITMRRVHHAGGTEDAEVFSIHLMLPNNVGFRDVLATRCQLPTGSQVLIGMDIITVGDFAITNTGGKTVCSFRTPSTKRIDYVQEHQNETLREKFQHGGSKKDRKRNHKTFGKNKHK